MASVQFSSVAQSCPILCDSINRSTPGLPVHHQLPEFTQTHVHRVTDATSHLILCHPLLLLPPIPPSIRVFSNESTLHEVAKVLEFQLHISPSNEHPIIPLIALIAIFIFYFVFNCYFSFVFLCFNLVSNQGPCIVIIRHNFLGFPNSQDVP